MAHAASVVVVGRFRDMWDFETGREGEGCDWLEQICEEDEA